MPRGLHNNNATHTVRVHVRFIVQETVLQIVRVACTAAVSDSGVNGVHDTCLEVQGAYSRQMDMTQYKMREFLQTKLKETKNAKIAVS